MSTPPPPSSDTAPDAAGRWRFGAAAFDERTLQLSVRGVEIAVPRKSLLVLHVLLRHAGEVVTKDELIETCWPGRILSDTVLTTTVSRLREALSDDDQALIQTVKGYGYRLQAPVSYDGPAPVLAPRLNLQAGDHPPGRPEWRLTESLGAGGQADVWLGRDASGKTCVFKFAIDRRAVSGLKREVAIGRLLRDAAGEDAGFLQPLDWSFDTQPAFLASDYIAGGSLEQWSGSHGGPAAVPLELRLDLAAQCAELLALAHAAGVLHKDLKPANVLIDDSGAAPRALLCDFGSGAVLDRERLQRYALTRIGVSQQTLAADSSSGTPLYLAPEVLAGMSPTERSDIYSLGVLLFQLVVGDFRRPLAAGWEAEVPDELLREDIALTATGNPQRRLGDAAELARRLRSLDARREARGRELAEARRAEALQRELERHRQRRPLVLGIGALLVVGVVGLSLLGWKLSRALADARRHEALETSVNEFLQRDILAGAAPNAAGKPDPTMLDVLKRAQDKVAERFAGQPLQEGAVRTTLGSAWHLIGNDADAEDQLRKAIATLEALGDDALLEAALAHVVLGKNLSIRGIAEYSEHFDRAEALAARSHDPERWKVIARSHLARARVHGFSGRASQALELLDPLHREVAARLPADDAFRLSVDTEYLTQLAQVGRYAEALSIAEVSLPVLTSGRSASPGNAAELRRTMAYLLRKQGKLEESYAVYADALQRFTTVFGANAAETLNTRREIAVRRADDAKTTAETDAALAELRSLLVPIRAAQGELSYSCAVTDAIVEAMIGASRWDSAEADARAAIVEAQTYDKETPLTLALGQSRLAHVLTQLHHYAEAAPLFEVAMPVIERDMEPEHPVYRLAEQRYAAFQAVGR
ncbi:protein kinase domain-containing protein [Nevskia ramosa]|uniref:protein kinase domain-containing protein n=1 Tax=Nevskia ramosa TaxID=64002 RepID=UPI002352AA38|nr:winged helix-turn-helix domain-containing protein [Nevskia ramosa]